MPSNKWKEKHQKNLDLQRDRFTAHYERNPEKHPFDPSNSFPGTVLNAYQIMAGSVKSGAENITLHFVKASVRGPAGKSPKYKFVDSRDGTEGTGGDMLVYDHKIESVNYGQAYYQLGVTGDDPHTSGRFYLGKVPKEEIMKTRGFVKSTQLDEKDKYIKDGAPGRVQITKYLYVKSITHSYLEIDFDKITRTGQAPKRKTTTIKFSDPGTENINLNAPRWMGRTRTMSNGEVGSYGEPPKDSMSNLENINPEDLWTQEDQTICKKLYSKVMTGAYSDTEPIKGASMSVGEKDGLETTFEREYEAAAEKVRKAYKKGKLTEEKKEEILKQIKGEDDSGNFTPSGPTASISTKYYSTLDIDTKPTADTYQFGWLEGQVRILVNYSEDGTS